MKKYYYVKFGLSAIISALILSLIGSVSIAQVPTVNISASPTNIQYYETSTLTWNSENATSAKLDGVPVLVNGSTLVSPNITTTYTIVVNNIEGSAFDSVTVTVTEAYLTAVSDDEIDLDSLGSVKPGDTFTSTRTLLIGHSNLASVNVSLSGTDLTREETNAVGQGIGSYDVLPTTYSYSISYNRELSNDININLDIIAETKGPGDEDSSDAGIYEGSFIATLSGSL